MQGPGDVQLRVRVRVLCSALSGQCLQCGCCERTKDHTGVRPEFAL